MRRTVATCIFCHRNLPHESHVTIEAAQSMGYEVEALRDLMRQPAD